MFCVVPERTELSDIVLQQTGSRLATLEDADYVLCDAASLPDVLRRSKDGTLEYPDRGATVVCLVAAFRRQATASRWCWQGPASKTQPVCWSKASAPPRVTLSPNATHTCRWGSTSCWSRRTAPFAA